ncbi:MAG: HNH endonuclease [Anaerolineaceae bacterium]|nr:HNH endonuclease [Anaerolineaceae bacterium]
MRCIFCKSNSSTSKTIEHIIPESLGNVEHILPRGVVCDSCNNYFARRLEKPVLESGYFVQLRFRNGVENKKGRIPNIRAIHQESLTIVELDPNKESSIYPSREKDAERFIQSVLQSKTGHLVFPVGADPDHNVMSRFIGKIALEALVSRVLTVEGGLDEIIDHPELNLIRNYVRRGHSNLTWPFHRREIYEEDKLFNEEGYGEYQMLHEFTFLYTDEQELFFVLAIFGVEYTINLGEPDTSGYIKWLAENSNKSPLYL